MNIYNNGYHSCECEIKRNSDKCKGCIYFDYYRDMGISTPVCTLETDLGKAAQKANKAECNEKITKQEAIDKVKKYDEKETPMTIQIWELAKPVERCPKCGAGLEKYHLYCWNCGQSIDWRK